MTGIIHKVVVASDSFKGCLRSDQVAAAVAEGFQNAIPGCDVVKLTVGDGGEGTMDALISALGGKRVVLTVQDPLGRPVEAEYAILTDGSAVIEISKCSGLMLLSAQERNPLKTSTYGAGQLIADALDRGCRRFRVCIGGSATNDAGTGMLEALGYRFVDFAGTEMNGCGEALEKIAHIDSSAAMPEIKEAEFIVACDVDSPLYGPKGAAYVFAPQKGADAAMVEELDRGLRHFADIMQKCTGLDVADMPGAGAAGGLGAAFKAFLNAELKKGADMVLDAVRFDEQIVGADLVITGEGKIDSQTMAGKLPAAVAERAAAQNVPVVAICGYSDIDILPGFHEIYPVTPESMPLHEAMNPETAGRNIIRTIEDVIAAIV